MKKGFTLIELTVIIAVLGFILMISVPKVLNLIAKSKIEIYLKNERAIIKIVKSYFTENYKLLPKNEGETVEISIETLKEEEYLKKIENFDDKCNGYVLITKLESGYEYIPHIKCGDSNTIGSSLEDGLVLHYTFDDFQEPTENLITNPTYEKISSSNEFMQYCDLAPIIDLYGTDEKYSLSLDLKSSNISNKNSMLVYMQNGSSTKYSFVNSSVNVLERYQRFYFENLSPAISTSTDTNAKLAFYGTYGTGNYPGVKNVQVELKEYSTPFVDGSREGIVKDYSKNNNEANLSIATTPRWLEENDNGYYEFNEKYSFEVADNDCLHFGNFSVFVWLNHKDFTYPKTFAPIKKSNPNCYLYNGKGWDIGHGYKSNGVDFCIGDGINKVRSTLVFDAGNEPNKFLNKWLNLSIVVDRINNKVYSYINGKQQNFILDISSVTGNTFSTSNLIYGNVYGWKMDGYMDDVKIYNRTLSAEEIKYQYDTTKHKYE